MARIQDGADLAVRLEASYARSMTGSRIDHDKGTLVVVDLDVVGGHDPNEPVIDRTLQLAPVHDFLEVVLQDVLDRLGRVLEILVAALPHDIPEKDVTLPAIRGVFPICLQ